MEEDLLKNQGMQINIKMTKSSFLENKKKSQIFIPLDPGLKKRNVIFGLFFGKYSILYNVHSL